MIYLLIIISFSILLVFSFRKIRKQNSVKHYKTVPLKWKLYLQENVRFYQKLSENEKDAFETRILFFLNTTRIVGFENLKVSEIEKLLVGVSAIIPIFRFPNWEYDFLNEVIIYPKAIPGEGKYKGSFINGLVGDGPMEGRMILAKTALLHGYSNYTDRRNVGVHEFAHIIDKQDGKIDGVPEVLLDGSKIGAWLELIRSKSLEIKNKGAKINSYALSNDAEFFAVVTEYFFEHPEMMHKKHPELFETLTDIFTTNNS